jgi:hypothetical protein
MDDKIKNISNHGNMATNKCPWILWSEKEQTTFYICEGLVDRTFLALGGISNLEGPVCKLFSYT